MKVLTTALMLKLGKKKVVFKKEDLILNFDRIRADVTDFIRGNPIVATAVGLGVPLTFGGIAVVGKSLAGRKRKKAKKKKSKSTRRKTTKSTRKSRKCPAKRKRKAKRKFGLRKAVSSKKIRMTKKGQPFIILADGRARFIKKSSARSARKRKGGFS